MFDIVGVVKLTLRRTLSQLLSLIMPCQPRPNAAENQDIHDTYIYTSLKGCIALKIKCFNIRTYMGGYTKRQLFNWTCFPRAPPNSITIKLKRFSSRTSSSIVTLFKHAISWTYKCVIYKHVQSCMHVKSLC